MLKYTKPFLEKLEDVTTQAGYILRYEKGSFKAGYCLLNDTKVVIINKFFTLEARINCLTELLRNMEIDQNLLSDKNRELLKQIRT